MVIDLLVTKSLDGFSAEIPSIKGCETWAADEEIALQKILDLASFYLKIPVKKFSIDKARIEDSIITYKLIFNKEQL